VEVVRDTARELPNGLHALRPLQHGRLLLLGRDVMNERQIAEPLPIATEYGPVDSASWNRAAVATAELHLLWSEAVGFRFEALRIFGLLAQDAAVLALNLLFGQSEQPRESWIDETDHVFWIGYDHGVREVFED